MQGESSPNRLFARAAICAAVASLVPIGCNLPGRDAQPGLNTLRVIGGEGLYPSFDPGVHHYAVRCADGTTLHVIAQAHESEATLRLLHNDRTATGAVEASVTVDGDQDVAIEVSEGRGTATYYLHCIPPDFPDITIETRTDSVSEGLLLMTPSARRSDESFLAIVDNNGVPRWVMRPNVRARQFRRYSDGRYSFAERGTDGNEIIVILDSALTRIDIATLGPPLLPEHTGGHDFLITANGNFLLMSHYPALRDLSGFQCRNDDASPRPCSTMEPADDSIVQEVTPDGVEVFRWNSWDHVKVSDCTIHRFPNDYAHLNSLYELEGDIVAGLRGCAQILRIERASGAVVWQIGGSEPMRADRPTPLTGVAPYLPVVGDGEAKNEFCGQHSVSATAAGSLLMFDNGTHCLGERKNDPPFTRVVEYDISSGTEARFVREYRLPEADGVATSGGGVTELKNGNWLITWGNNGPTIAVSEVDPDGNEVFRVRMTRDGVQYGTGRVSREPESALNLPVNLP